MLEAERALAAACGTPPGSSRPTRPRPWPSAAASSSTTSIRFSSRARRPGNPVEPLVRALRARVGAAGGATGCTAAQRARTSSTAPRCSSPRGRAGSSLDRRVGSRGGRMRALRRSASRDADGRPHAAAAGRADDVRARCGRLARRSARRDAPGSNALRSDGFAAQLGGAAGTLGAFGADGPAVADAFARRLGLAQPTLPWHTNRVRVTEARRRAGGARAAPAGRSAATSRCSRRPRWARSPRRRARAWCLVDDAAEAQPRLVGARRLVCTWRRRQRPAC